MRIGRSQTCLFKAHATTTHHHAIPQYGMLNCCHTCPCHTRAGRGFRMLSSDIKAPAINVGCHSYGRCERALGRNNIKTRKVEPPTRHIQPDMPTPRHHTRASFIVQPQNAFPCLFFLFMPFAMPLPCHCCCCHSFTSSSILHPSCPCPTCLPRHVSVSAKQLLHVFFFFLKMACLNMLPSKKACKQCVCKRKSLFLFVVTKMPHCLPAFCLTTTCHAKNAMFL